MNERTPKITDGMLVEKVNTPVVTGDKDTDALLHTEQINQEKPDTEVGLHSVGTVFDTETLVIYPMFIDGTADYDCPHCLEDVEDEWYRQLDKDDLLVVHIAVIHRMKVEDSLSKLLDK